MISADMPHGEAREGSVQEIRERADLSDAVKRRLLGDDAAESTQFKVRARHGNSVRSARSALVDEGFTFGARQAP